MYSIEFCRESGFLIFTSINFKILISRNTIDAVFETARVEEVIGDFVQLKKSGSNYKGLSPFTDERTPSFMVSPAKQIWKDFSSGKGGNVVSFLMEHEHFTYPEAIRFLARRYGIEIEETEQSSEEKEKADERESLYLINDFAKKFFHRSLMKTEEGKAIGLSYFRERGFTTDTIEKFELGYSPEKWDALTEHALKKGYQLEYLEKSGLTIVREDTNTGEKKSMFDRFRNRIIFPIKSMSGRTLGFGGRILTSDKRTAKYLNSPESEIYIKSRILYGIFEAKQSIAKEDNCYLVEGYTDVIQMHQKGVENVVASSGTALTPEQIRLINRLTPNITVLFDGDPAGLRAALRGVDLILEQGMNVKIVTFPEGDDPDSFAKNHSKEEILEYFSDNAQDFISFKATLLRDEAKNDPIEKSNTINEIISSISKIPDPIKRELYLRECARIMDITEEVLFNALAQTLHKNHRESTRKSQPKQQQPFEVVAAEEKMVESVNPQDVLERKLMELLVLYGNEKEEFTDMLLVDSESEKVDQMYRVYEKIYMDLQMDEIEFTDPDFRRLFKELVHLFQENPESGAEDFIGQLEVELAAIVSDILMEDERYQLHDWERKEIYVRTKRDALSQMVTETIFNLRRILIDKKIEDLAEKLQNTPEEERASGLEEIMRYIGLKKLVSNFLNRVV